MAEESTFEPELVEIEALLRELDPADLDLMAPPVDVWAGISAELGGELETIDGHAGGSVVPLRAQRSLVMPLMAAAAAVLVVVAASVAIVRSGDDTTTLASAELAYDAASFDPAGASASATALLVELDGTERIRLDDATLPFELDEDAALELWLIQVDDTGIVDLVSLGDIDPDGDRTFAVPAGYDPSVYSVVDISIEPRDGDATHSGRSILRGGLDQA
jgi:hypothetical protein